VRRTCVRGDNVGVALPPSVDLHGERVRLRPTTPDDAAVLHTILCMPGVAQWWPNVTREECEEIVTGDGVAAFVIEFDGDAIGLIQYSEERDPDYEHAGIDIAIHDAWQGRGLGADAVRTLARHLIRDRGIHRLTIDPAAANARAIRCYEKVGFRPVGVMREYERGGDGTWHDGLLMDLLPADLTEPDAGRDGADFG
jgi:aminoglycoside 6'-N-acetyltransferase